MRLDGWFDTPADDDWSSGATNDATSGARGRIESPLLADDLDDTLLPTIALVHAPHPTIPNLFQCCFEYVNPRDWSAEAERVETGSWFFGASQENS